MAWTEERMEKLKKLWLANELTVQQIGDIFELPRGAISGKAHRMGLPKKKNNIKSAQIANRKSKRIKSKQKKTVKNSRHTGRRQIPNKHQGPEEYTPPAELEKIETNPKKPKLLDLQKNQCHYIYGEPKQGDYHYCGMPTQIGTDYCDAHHAIMFRPSQSNQRFDAYEYYRRKSAA